MPTVEISACKIGTDPSTSASNQHSQIHGVPGLFVSDNSALPTLTATGAILSNIALSMRLADHIVRESK
ncbi:GMC oxidoreductase [Alkalibaculum bacchi]|uniref:GMC oxidoreductase n=1 Tax=Alkalibaculum bacchi TaxID=645887 RepID=UPI000DE96A4A|nr:GMC oxidoreductase [Alkalibaculum bacchi]